jgi:hypothetical protein
LGAGTGSDPTELETAALPAKRSSFPLIAYRLMGTWVYLLTALTAHLITPVLHRIMVQFEVQT